MANTEKKYFVKQSWIFNLESMNDKLHCIEYDVEDHKLDFPFEIAGTMINDFDDLAKLREECSNLKWEAWGRKIDGKTYGRIKQIVEWRVNQRYMTCLSKGMSDYDAGQCFSDI